MEIKTRVRTEIKDADKGTFIAIFSTLNTKDHDGDVTMPSAFESGAKMPVSSYGHSSWSGRLPVGKASIVVTAKEAQAHGQFFLDTQDGADTFRVVKSLAEDGMGEWSYGYDPVKVSYGQWPVEGDEPKDQVRFLEGLKVHEVSPVLLGAGIDTMTVSAKAKTLNLDEVTDDEIRSILRGMAADRLKALMPEGMIKLLLDGEIQVEEFDATLLAREQVRYEQLRFDASGR